MRYRIATFDDIIAEAGGSQSLIIEDHHPPIVAHALKVEQTQLDYVLLNNVVSCRGGGLIWNDCWICGDEIQYYPTEWRFASWLPGDIDWDRRTIDIPLSQPVEIFEAPALYCDCTVSFANFAHFVHDLLPYGYLFRSVRREYPALRPFISALKWESQQYLFSRVFGINSSDCLVSTGVTCFKNLIVFRRQTKFDGHVWRTSIKGLREASNATVTAANEPAAYQGLKVFLHRFQDIQKLRTAGLLHGRDFTNLAPFLNIIADKGFVILEPGLTPISTVSTLLANASCVAGIHGANLGNIIFCRPKTKVFELRPAGGVWRDLEALALCLNLDFNAIDQTLFAENSANAIDIAKTLDVFGTETKMDGFSRL